LTCSNIPFNLNNNEDDKNYDNVYGRIDNNGDRVTRKIVIPIWAFGVYK